MNDPWGPVEALIVVRTYPVPSLKSVEVSCTAAITKDQEWLRLYPVPYRLLDEEKQFSKYQWITARIKSARDRDPRPESRRIDVDSIEVSPKPIGTDHDWAERRRVITPLKADSMCALRAERNEKGAPTLGFIRPARVDRLVIEHIGGNWTQAERQKLERKPLWGNAPARALEKIPFEFSYRYSCEDRECAGHQQMCSDWEMSEAYRNFKGRYGSGWEDAFRQRFEVELPEKRDLHFFVGTVSDHPGSWIIIGLWYPPLDQQGFLPLPRDG